MFLHLIILSTIYVSGVSAMKGNDYISAEYSEFVVSIWYYHEHRCSGSILDDHHVLTSGNCVVHMPISSLSVAAGITQSSPRDLQLISVKNVHYHPEFRGICLKHGFYWENDIAVLELSESFRWEKTLAAVPLIDVEFNWDPCYKCQIFGWDDETVNNVKSLTLKWSLGQILTNERCEMNVTLLKNEKSLKNEFSSVLEDGDYGAPVVCGGSAVGIIVHGGAKEGSPPVLLNIYPYLDFITNIFFPNKINVPGQFPYYVALFHNDQYRCGGAIIDVDHIVTAAHCVEDSTAYNLFALLGRSEFSVDELSTDEFISIDHVQQHPNYERYSRDDGVIILRNDIAVLKLRTSIVQRNNVKAIGLANYLPVGEPCQVHRWSRLITADGTGLAKSLSSPIDIQDPSMCQYINPFRQSTDFCTINMYSLPIATDGDSGSPMVCKGLVVGVLSSHTLSSRVFWGPYQGIYYTSIYTHANFIHDVISGKTF